MDQAKYTPQIYVYNDTSQGKMPQIVVKLEKVEEDRIDGELNSRVKLEQDPMSNDSSLEDNDSTDSQDSLARVYKIDGKQQDTEKPDEYGAPTQSLAVLYKIDKHRPDTEKSYECKVCHQRFSKKRHLEDHSAIHSRETLTCPICHRQYKQKAYLESHIQMFHTEEKGNECSFCHIRFARNLDLRYHLKAHMEELKDIRYECKLCSYKGKKEDELERHMLKHTGEMPFECHVCHRKFGRKANLQGHLKTHTGKKPFRCDVCHLWFDQKSSLQMHKMKHTGEKPFQCDLCQRTFAQKLYLYNHRRKHNLKGKFERRKRSVKNKVESGVTNAKSEINK